VPTYGYSCGACGERFEIICSFAEREQKAVCPACGGRDVREVFGSIGRPGRGASLNPGHFERPHRGAVPRWVGPDRRRPQPALVSCMPTGRRARGRASR
jgi:putative FmdB family regulatory protein